MFNYSLFTIRTTTAFYFEICITLPFAPARQVFSACLFGAVLSASHASSRFSCMMEWLSRCHGDHGPWSPLLPPFPHCCFFSLPFPQVLRKVSGNQQIANQAASLRGKNGGQMRRRTSDPSRGFLTFFFFGLKMCDFFHFTSASKSRNRVKAETRTLEPIRPNGETDTCGWLSSHCSDLCIFFQAEAAF